MTAFEIIKSQFVNDLELASLLNVTKDRIRDLKSMHKNGKGTFIDSYSPSSTVTYFKVGDVIKYILSCKNDRQIPDSTKESETETEDD